MFPKAFCFFVSAILLIATTACAASDQKLRVPADATPAALIMRGKLGTGDSGGGNSYQGKPLESYIVPDPTQLGGYNKVVVPIREKLKFGAENSFFEPLFKYSFGKTWYLLPGPLNQLPSGQIGSAVPTDQAALQDMNSVWIDSTIFNKMSRQDQGRLILHEFLMSIKLARFDSEYQQCLLQYSYWDPMVEDDCQYSPTEEQGSPLDLLPSDYDDIRKMVVELENLPEKSDFSDVVDLFAKGNFGWNPNVFRKKNEKRFLSQDDVIDLFKEMVNSRSIPANLFNSEVYPWPSSPVSPSGSCEFGEFKYGEDSISFHASAKEDSGVTHDVRIQFANPAEITAGYLINKGRNSVVKGTQFVSITAGPFEPMDPKASIPQVGDKSYEVKLILNYGAIEGIQIYQKVITKILDGPGYMSSETAIVSGTNFACGKASSY